MKLNRTAKQAFFTARKRSGDVSRISEMTGYSASHVTSIMNGNRNVNDAVANAMYSISARRQKNSVVA
jgi:ABC-type molybdenum transport system ATPase subunit/photorepair protein PhrA